MPFTAFHAVPVWLLWMKFPRRLDLLALTVGAVIPDLPELLVVSGLVQPDWTYPHRDWTHSLVGALTFDAVLGLAGLVLVVRPLFAWARHRYPSGLWNHFAGKEFPLRTSWMITLVSLWIGTLSHALIDVPFHGALRLFFPFYGVEPRIWVFHWTLQSYADLASNVIFGPAFAYLVYLYWWRPSRQAAKARAAQSRAN